MKVFDHSSWRALLPFKVYCILAIMILIPDALNFRVLQYLNQSMPLQFLSIENTENMYLVIGYLFPMFFSQKVKQSHNLHIYTIFHPSHQPISAYYHQLSTNPFCLRGWAQPDATAARGDGGCEGRWIHRAIICWHFKFGNKEVKLNMLREHHLCRSFFAGTRSFETLKLDTSR